MEGEPEESDEDVQAEDRPTVLWEKCIQQSIFIDLSEDESLHLSDLESSLALHLSQAESAASEASIHLSGSAQLSGLDITSSESSTASGQSGSVVEDNNKSSMLPVSAKRPNTMQDDPPLNRSFEDLGQNTSDEDQDDLPYDGDLGSSYFNQTPNSESNTSSEGRETVHASPDVPDFLEYNTRNEVFDCSPIDGHNPERPASLMQDQANAKQENMLDASRPSDFPPPCPGPADINQLLLRHFSQEELLRSGRLIEAETLPEVSLLESVDDTILSCALMKNTARTNSNSSDHAACNSEISQSFCTARTDQKNKTASENSNSEEGREGRVENVTAAPTDSLTSSSASTDSKQGSVDTSSVEAVKQMEAGEDDEVQRVPLFRTRSFSEMKYGQGQVHYPLPDFSKVAPKVKIPKAPSGPVRPVPQGPSSIHRAQSSPGMLDLVSRVLEDSVLPAEKPYVFKDESITPPALVHHLQAEYDKLLTKYAEAENLIDQMRLGTNVQASDTMLDLECEDDHQENCPAVDGSHPRALTPHLPSPGDLGEKRETAAPQSNIKEVKEVDAASCSPPEEELTDGERMTAELRDIISQYMQKVEEFKVSVRNMSVSTAEQQMMLRSIMEAQDQLERKYMSKKEEHRALEMQNYMGLSRNTGTFDPNRLVEGDIFRLGMHIEDIKEMIDLNVCEQISPPHSSSTPTALKEALHENPSPVCMRTPSPASALHEGLRAVFSTVGFMTEIQKEEENGLEEPEEASEVHRDDGLQHSRFSAPSCFRSSQGCVDLDLDRAAEAEEGTSSVLLEAIDHSNILEYLDGCSSSPRPRQGTPSSCSTPDGVLHPVGECDLGDSVSLAVGVSRSSDAPRLSSSTDSFSEPPLNTSCSSQRIVSPETDSGFGSSYLNQSGSFQQSLLTESTQSQSSALGSSDSEGSCSNLQTAIHPASLSSHRSINTQASGAAASVEWWVESTTKKPSVRQQKQTRSSLHHHVSEPILSSTMDAEERGSPLHSCTCNSEAIVALQSEVSRLKKDLEEGLVQLPHLTQKMDYLTSKYRHEREQRRSKSRTRSHLRASCNSDLKLSSRQNENNLSSNQVKIEDWISSDMDPSKSKGTDSGDTAGSETLLHSHISPVGGSRASVDMQHKHHGSLQSRRGSEGNCTLSTSALKGGKEEAPDSRSKLGLQTAAVESFYTKERWSVPSSPSLQKPLLQVSYASSSSLPASYKVRELQLETTPHHRQRSTQSDTALLPSNVYFQRTVSPGWLPPKAGSRTGRRRGSEVSEDEEMNRTLDRAIEMARHMKRTTDRMAKKLSSDLVKAQLHRRLHSSLGPLGGRKHHAL